uniref:Uncharacterized protein n=1 Tax=viral metagenome TaxID=1070528 RepID=A0A6C0BNF6_9ZZZZ
MQGFKNDEHKFVMFLHARVGCGSLKNWFLALKGIEAKGKGEPHKSCLPFQTSTVPAGYYAFQVVRNPLARLVSFYKQNVVYKQRNWEYMGRDWTFERVVRHLVTKAPCDARCIPQVKEGLELKRIVHLESLSEDMEAVQKDLGLNLAWNFYQKSCPSPETKCDDVKKPWKITGHQMVAHRIWPHWEVMYNDELRKLATQIYLRDMQVLGYGDPRPEPAPTLAPTPAPTAEPTAAPAPTPTPSAAPASEPEKPTPTVGRPSRSTKKRTREAKPKPATRRTTRKTRSTRSTRPTRPTRRSTRKRS